MDCHDSVDFADNFVQNTSYFVYYNTLKVTIQTFAQNMKHTNNNKKSKVQNKAIAEKQCTPLTSKEKRFQSKSRFT